MMLDLDNLDLELDEDFPTSPLGESKLFESSFVGSLPLTGSKADENLAPSKCKSKIINHLNSEKTQTKDVTNDPILKLLESSEKNQQKDNVKELHNIFTGQTNKILNNSFSPNKFFDIERSDINGSKDLGKRILTHRKFPGPAGILPDKPLNHLSDINVIIGSSLENVSTERQKEAVILCSQASSVFTEHSFKKLASDFDLNNDNCPLKKYTVDWVKKRALKKTLCGKKVPFLAVVLHNLDHGTPDPVITLRDQTGEIYGTLHREVWSELGGKLQPGAALALRQVGVLITGIARRQVHLNITSNNIINIYSYISEEIVETNSVNKLDKSDLLKSVKEWHISASNVEQNVPSNPFSVVGGNKSPHLATPIMKNQSSYKTPAPSNGSNSKNNCSPNIRTTTAHPSSSKNVNSKNCINFMSSMEDDMSDFLASLGESDLDENLLKEKKVSSTAANIECDNNIRKRKIDATDVSFSNKTHCHHFKENFSDDNGYVPPTKKVEYQEKFILANQPLSQAESQIVEEVLDGIDFDDFDT